MKTKKLPAGLQRRLDYLRSDRERLIFLSGVLHGVGIVEGRNNGKARGLAETGGRRTVSGSKT